MTKQEIIEDGGQALLSEAGGIDFVSLMDGYGVIHHLTSRALTVEKAEQDMFALVGNLLDTGAWTVHNDVREVLQWGNKTKQSDVSRNADSEETRTPLDPDTGEPLVKDAGGHLPGEKAYWHVKNLELSRLKEGKVKVTMTGVLGQDEKPAEFPFLSTNMPLNMAIHTLDIIKPEVKEEGYFDQPHDEPVDWKVEYQYANKMNDKGYYWKNITGITEWA